MLYYNPMDWEMAQFIIHRYMYNGVLHKWNNGGSGKRNFRMINGLEKKNKKAKYSASSVLDHSSKFALI